MTYDRSTIEMGTLGGFPNPPATLRCQQSWQASPAIIALLAGCLSCLAGCASSANTGTQAIAAAPQAANPGGPQPAAIGGKPSWKVVAPGDMTTLAVRSDGSLWVWGWNRKGGDGTGTNFSLRIEGGQPPVALRPTRVGQDADWQSVACSGDSMLALKTDGTLWGWPRERLGTDPETNPEGETARSPTSAFPLPRPLHTDNDWSQIATGAWQSFALKSDGTLWGWGTNHDGTLGDGTRVDQPAPVRIGKELWRFVAASFFGTLAIRRDGTLWIWGWRSWEDKASKTQVPTQIGTENGWRQASISSSHVLALKSDGSLWSVGVGEHGGRASGSRSGSGQRLAVRIGAESDWIATAAGEDFFLALKRDGSLWASGANARGQLGDGTTTNRDSLVPVGKGAAWRSVVAREDHVVAEQADGSLWVWGNNDFGQLGDGRPIVELEPAQIMPGSHWRFAADAIALREDGTLFTWMPGRVESHAGPHVEWLALAQHRGLSAIGIQKDGSLWQLSWPKGGLEKIERDSYADVGPDPRWQRLSVSEQGVVVQDARQRLWSLGRLTINNGPEIWQASPIGGSTAWGPAFAEIAPGTVMAQKPDGTLWLVTASWKNEKPVQLDKNVKWESFAVGESEILALDATGQLWRYDGEGNKERVGGKTSWKMASVSKHHTLAVARDGTLWSWGEGHAGELGTVYEGEQPSPVRVGKDASWAQAFAAENHSLAIKTDGSLWAWGNNRYGELAIGPPVWRALPVKLDIP